MLKGAIGCCCFLVCGALALGDDAKPEAPGTTPGAAGGPADGLEAVRASLGKYIEVRQQISRTRADWDTDKETLEQMATLFERELKAVDEQVARQGTQSAQVDKERLESTASLQASNAQLERVKEFADGFERKVRELVPRLPVPLQEMLTPLLNKLPADPANTRMAAAERFQVMVGILNELDKFNNGLTVASEKRKNGRGEEVAVETVYVGLGAAYFVNDAGDFAGMGGPGPQGWEWTVEPALAPSVREVIRIYRNERPARFVALPARIQ